jgi:type IV pilus assembly protein PilA
MERERVMLQKLGKKLKDQKGLTLVELLAVIVILGIIAAIAIPSIGGLINKTRDDAKVAEAIQIIDAAKLYVTTNPKAGDLKHSDLDSYLDNVTETGYTVTVTKDTTSKKFKYSIKDHSAVKIVDKDATSVSEADLQKFTGARD